MLTLTYVLLWLAMVAYVAHPSTGSGRSLVSGGRWTGWAATGATLTAWGVLTGGLVRRGLVAGHWPLTNRYEFALCFLWVIVTVYLLLEANWRERRAGAFVLAVALLVATFALLRPTDEQTIRPLLPILRSIWLQIHVLSAAIGYGVCGVAAGLAVMRLVSPASSEETQEILMERIVTLGFPWLTLGLLSGAIWAQNAWGRYWGWDPKETWALLTWLWYLLILHVRGVHGWRGRRLAALVLAGFGIVFFTLAGLPWLIRTVRLESLHGF